MEYLQTVCKMGPKTQRSICKQLSWRKCKQTFRIIIKYCTCKFYRKWQILKARNYATEQSLDTENILKRDIQMGKEVKSTKKYDFKTDAETGNMEWVKKVIHGSIDDR